MESRASGLLWFEKLNQRLHLPFWAGTLAIGSIPTTALLPISYYAAGKWDDFLSQGVLVIMPYLFILTILLLYSARYVRRHLEGLAAYASALLPRDQAPDLRELYSLRGFLVTLVILATFVQSFYFFGTLLPRGYSPLEALELSAAFIYWNAFVMAFVWPFIYTMYKVRKIGGMPLILKPFTEDRTLGLKPFGRMSLELTGLYLLIMSAIFIPQTLFVPWTPPLVFLGILLTLMGVAFFFLPLLGVHAKLLEAKKEAAAWIAPQYTDLMDRLVKMGIHNSDEKLFQELTAIDKIQRDIGQIHSWPLDVGIVTRLAAIIFSVIAILLANLIRIALHF